MPSSDPWFAGKQAMVLLFKVNRRPLAQMSVLGDVEPDPFVHFVETLPFGEPVETSGRGGRRTWFLGDQDVLPDRVLLGQIGWQREEPLPVTRFDVSHSRWVDDVARAAAGNHAPFVYDGETGRLAVLRHPSFRPQTVAYVFTALLNRGERRRPATTVEWAVEPLLDVSSFRAWLETTQVVQRVTFEARLPNPDALSEFEDVLRRLEARNAAALFETWEARDREVGLQDIEEDRDAAQMLAMAEYGYGYVKAKGLTRRGRTTRFNQRQTVRTETTPPLPSTWGEMIGMFIDFALSQVRGRDTG